LFNKREQQQNLAYRRQLDARSSKRETGFVAQDVERAVKESGYTAFNGVYAPTNPKDNYALDYSKMVVPLVKAVQEQQYIINKLQQTNRSAGKKTGCFGSKKIIRVLICKQ
jgi:hypothetical protein